VSFDAREELRQLLAEQGLPERSWYTTAEVARILGFSIAYIKRLCAEWEPIDTPGRNSRGLESLKTPGAAGHWRIRVGALVRWLENNHTYKRARI